MITGQFVSLQEPFVILFSVPLSVIGVALALSLINTTLCMTAGSGVVMLAGSWLRPILVTTLTTVLAMVPLALGVGVGAETWALSAKD